MNKNKEKAILSMVPIFYLIGTFGVIKGNVLLALFFFCAQSVLLAVLSYFFVTKSGNKEDVDDMSEEIIHTMEQQATEHKQRITALEKELMDITAKLEDKTKELDQANRLKDTEQESLKARIEDLENKEPGEGGVYDFLPPISEEEENVETIDIIKTARETAKELEDFAKKEDIAVEVSTAMEKLLVRGNESRMKILFKNIIDNSVKYMRKAGRLIITISNIGDDIFIVLKDNGLGLDAEETKHIFELNYQGSNRISGNGLGLAQARAIVEYYGGTIYAKSNKERGMGIYIQLPTT